MTPIPQTLLAAFAQRSARPIENAPAVERYLAEALAGERTLTFFNWECPPRTLSRTSEGAQYVNYDVDLPAIFRGEVIDDYTELPRVVEHADEEIAFCAWLASLGLRCRLVKVIADTNATYLTPDSLAILGPDVVEARFEEFRTLIAERLAAYPLAASVCRFTELTRPLGTLYNDIYTDALARLRTNPASVLPPVVLQAQLERTRHHMGLSDAAQVEDFSLKTIATYAAEGIVLSRLTATEAFSNCIWLNNHEVDDRTIAITNYYRRRLGQADLPMVFAA